MHNLTLSVFELPPIEEWFAGDDRALAFQVVNDDGVGVDISEADISWSLFERAYQTNPADAVLDDTDGGVELVTDARVDTSVGEFEIRVDGEATASHWGEFYHRPEVEQIDGTVASWRGEVTLEA